MPAAGVHVAAAHRKARDCLWRDGRRSALCGRVTWIRIYVFVGEPRCVPANQAYDPVRFYRTAARACRPNIEDAQTERGRGQSARDRLSHMKRPLGRLWRYVRPHVGMLTLSVFLVAVVGILEAATPFLIGLVFDTLLRASATPTVTIPLVDLHLDLATSDGRVFLLLLVVVTAIKAAAEYGSTNTASYV